MSSYQIETLNIYTDLDDAIASEHEIISTIRKHAARLCGDANYKIYTLPSSCVSTHERKFYADAFFIKLWEDEKADIPAIVANKVHYMHHAEVFITSSLEYPTSGAITYAVHKRQMPVLVLHMFTDAHSATLKEKESASIIVEENNNEHKNLHLECVGNTRIVDAVTAILLRECKQNETPKQVVAEFFNLYAHPVSAYSIDDNNNDNTSNEKGFDVISNANKSAINKLNSEMASEYHDGKLIKWAYHVQDDMVASSKNHVPPQSVKDLSEAIPLQDKHTMQSSSFNRYRTAFEQEIAKEHINSNKVALLAPDGYPLYWGKHTPSSSHLLPPPLGRFELIEHKLKLKHTKQEEEQKQYEESEDVSVIRNSVEEDNNNEEHKSGLRCNRNANALPLSSLSQQEQYVSKEYQQQQVQGKSAIIDTSLLLNVLDILARYEHRGVLRMLLQQKYCVYLTVLQAKQNEEKRENVKNVEVEEVSVEATAAAVMNNTDNNNRNIINNKSTAETCMTKEKLNVFEEHWLEMPLASNM